MTADLALQRARAIEAVTKESESMQISEPDPITTSERILSPPKQSVTFVVIWGIWPMLVDFAMLSVISVRNWGM